ncbi:MAG: response regulator [Deltaproteobacteria bacterium]|nr:response regulator [Deltaproteobacteria bacterium]
MELKYKHTIMVVDDEVPITKTLNRLLRKEGFGVIEANSGADALEILGKLEKPVSGIISDQRMPGMTGSQLMEKVKKIVPDGFRILLTGFADINAITDALNLGQIHRYITKPWNDAELIFHIREALYQYELILENKRLNNLVKKQNLELKKINKSLEQKVEERTREIQVKNQELEQGLYNTVRAFASLVDNSSPAMEGHGRRVSLMSKQLAQALKLSEIEIMNVEIAALLHDIGKIGLPERLFFIDSSKMSEEEKGLYNNHPEEGQGVVKFIHKLDHVGLLIRSHHERYDGRGFPDQLSGDLIPLESQIISVADRYDKIVHLGIDKEKCIKDYLRERNITQDHFAPEALIKAAAAFYIKKNAFIEFAPDVVKVFLNYIEKQGVNDEDEKEIPVEKIIAGMILSRSLYTTNGRFLLPYNTKLTPDLVNKLKALQQRNPIIGNIYVKKKI